MMKHLAFYWPFVTLKSSIIHRDANLPKPMTSIGTLQIIRHCLIGMRLIYARAILLIKRGRLLVAFGKRL